VPSGPPAPFAGASPVRSRRRTKVRPSTLRTALSGTMSASCALPVTISTLAVIPARTGSVTGSSTTVTR